MRARAPTSSRPATPAARVPVSVHQPRQLRGTAGSRTRQPPPASAAPDPPSSSSVQLPTYLNTFPLEPEKRRFFYDDASAAVTAALNAGERRLRVNVLIPETNPEQDTFRIGTVLEMTRACAIASGRRCAITVQPPLGEGFFVGMPLSLSGVQRILETMDFGDYADRISVGTLGPGAAEVRDGGVVFVVAPQNIPGGSVMPVLMEATAAADAAGAAVVLINPRLRDVPSAAGVMGVRGRAERLADADSFTQAYQLRLLYTNPTIPYPIRGALRHVFAGPWQLYAREDVRGPPRSETYVLAAEFTDAEPGGPEITAAMKARREAVAAAERAAAAPAQQGEKKGWWW